MGQAISWIPYCGAAPLPGELITRWNFDPPLIAALMLAILARHRLLAADTARERRCFLAGIALISLLFVSPFCALTSALFSARAVHHLALTAVAAPLLAAAWPSGPVRGGVGLWAAVHAVTFWLWHAPPAYEAALSNDAAYWLMQASLLLAALALWRAVRAASLPAAIAALLATMVQMGLLGALLTLADTALYAPHALAPLAWGLTPLADQQLAGLIMWAPGAALYLAAALHTASRWFESERRASTVA